MSLVALRELGVSDDLAVYYARAGWLNRLGQGVYARPGPLDLHACLKVLDVKILGCHVGGRSALAWHGIQHYVRPDAPLLLYGWDAARLPAWFVGAFSAEYRRKRLFREAPTMLLGVSAFEGGDSAPLVAEPERALLELLSEVGTRQTLGEARQIMEGAYSLRQEVLLQLLRACVSVKTVRLCLSLSRELALPFAEALWAADLPRGSAGAWVGKTPEGWLVLKA